MERELTQNELAEYHKRVKESGVHGLEGIKIFQIPQLIKYLEKLQEEAEQRALDRLEQRMYVTYTLNIINDLDPRDLIPLIGWEPKQIDSKEYYDLKGKIRNEYWEWQNLIDSIRNYQYDLKMEPAKKQIIEINKEEPKRLTDIFDVPEWEKYFDALTKADPPLLKKTESGYRFVDKRGNKGLFGAWIARLKDQNIIKNYNRQQLAKLLNAEIIGLKIGTDGGVITEEKAPYNWKDYAVQLAKIIGE